ncbi:MAG: nitroreductase family protein [Acidimicrobiia bacterium]|nr:nitroreductase family protein [Acidimicrobiia bacterium]MDJ0664280.1 nitroreductase family protein [Acidimicrobiia bacterium]
MSNYDFVLGLRAIRGYGEQPVSSEHMTAILEAARWTGSAKNRQDWAFVVVTEREQLERVATCGHYTDPVRNSAATIVIVEEPGGYEFDSGRVAQNIMLAAKALGVASCPITLHHSDRVSEVLHLAEGRSCRYAVALGYPLPGAEPAVLGGRKPLADLVHWQTYGGSR